MYVCMSVNWCHVFLFCFLTESMAFWYMQFIVARWRNNIQPREQIKTTLIEKGNMVSTVYWQLNMILAIYRYKDQKALNTSPMYDTKGSEKDDKDIQHCWTQRDTNTLCMLSNASIWWWNVEIINHWDLSWDQMADYRKKSHHRFKKLFS